jgi:hypothetical protein
LPQVLPYPSFYPLTVALPHLRGRLVYLLRHYGTVGISVLIYREPSRDNVTVICGDWSGNSLDLVGVQPTVLTEACLKFIKDDLPTFLRMMQLTKLPQAQFFLAIREGSLLLVDVQVSLNKMAGPGMLRDVFGKIYPTQEVLKIESLDDRAIEYIEKGTGNYEGELIIKPSKFSVFSPNTELLVPLYVEVKRD